MKSRNVKITALLLCAVLITACFASSTLAYYKTETTKQADTARVARWSFNGVSVATFDLFKTSYETDGTEWANASSTEAIIAPGTIGSTSISVSGVPTSANAPEVDYGYGWEITIEASSSIADLLSYSIDGSDWKTKSEFEALFNGSEDKLVKVSAGQVPENNCSQIIYWKWAFGDDTTESSVKATNSISVEAKFIVRQVLANNEVE